jgi:hypothetical protein
MAAANVRAFAGRARARAAGLRPCDRLGLRHHRQGLGAPPRGHAGRGGGAGDGWARARRVRGPQRDEAARAAAQRAQGWPTIRPARSSTGSGSQLEPMQSSSARASGGAAARQPPLLRPARGPTTSSSPRSRASSAAARPPPRGDAADVIAAGNLGCWADAAPLGAPRHTAGALDWAYGVPSGHSAEKISRHGTALPDLNSCVTFSSSGQGQRPAGRWR